MPLGFESLAGLCPLTIVVLLTSYLGFLRLPLADVAFFAV